MTNTFKIKKYEDNENYSSLKGGKWNIQDEKKALTEYFNCIADNPNWNCIVAKTSGNDNYKLWFDVDDVDDTTENIINNINMILVKNLIEPDVDSALITKNIGSPNKRHIKYNNIFVNNSIHKALIDEINKLENKYEFDGNMNLPLNKDGNELAYVDNKARTGLRLDLCNKYDTKKKKFIENTKYVKEDDNDMTLEEFLDDYNILKTGELVEIKKGLIKKVEKHQKISKSKNINTTDLPEWVKLQLEQVKKDERFINKTAEGKLLNNMYVLNCIQGSLECFVIGKTHTSNRMKLELFQDPTKSRYGCHKCGKYKNLGYSFNQLLINLDEEENDDYFDIDKFLEIELDDDEAESEISKKINKLENTIETLEDEIDNLDDIDPDTLSKIQKKENKNLIKKKKKEIKKLNKEICKLVKLIKIEEKEEETLKDIELIKKRIPYFEEYHCKVLSPFCYIEKRRNKVSMYKHTEFIHKNLNLMKGDFIKEWLETSHIKEFDRVDFFPPPLKTPEGVYNTYTGLRIDGIKSYEETDFSKITDHIKLMVGVDEETNIGYNKKAYDYMLDYLAHMVQKVGELPRVALLFKGEQGTGKNIFWNLFGKKILGREYVLETAEMEKVVGRFNMLNQKFIVILDETTGKDSFTNSDKLKNIITQDTIAWEQKGIQGITINNCGRYIFLTNNDTPIKIEMTDRRFVVFEMNPEKRNNAEYFSNLVKDFNNDNVVMSFVNFLKNRDISNWNSIGDRPITKVYRDLQAVNIPIYARFLIDWCMKNDENKEYNGTSFFRKFTDYLEKGNFNLQISITAFGRFIKKYKGVISKRTMNGMKYYLNNQMIRDYLIEKGFMEKITLKDNCNEGLLIDM